MKKVTIASLVGGLILFLWQFISWNAANLHQSAQQYTPEQEKIMTYLNTLHLKEGGYIVPMPPPDASMGEWNKMMDQSVGKPWASIQYHSSLTNNMGMNMVRGFIINFLTVALFCWVLLRLKRQNFVTILTASLFTGLIVFFNVPYTNAIWYESFDTWAHLTDAVVSWGLCGVWLGWYLGKRSSIAENTKFNRRTAIININ